MQKYRNIPQRCSLQQYHASKLEAKRCDQLHLMQKSGVIRDLEAHPQPAISLIVNEMLVCQLIPDFRYVDEKGETVYEDTKGFATSEWKLKKKLAFALYRIDIKEIGKC